MATTLVNLRAILNDELFVITDGETAPFSTTLRNRAIAQGYAALWRAGCWKPTQQSIATVTDSTVYTTTIRRLRVVDLIDSAGLVVSHPPARIEETTSGAYQLILNSAMPTSSTLRVNGWNAYVSVFANDSASDDLDDEYNRIPLLKAKAICYRKALAEFARSGSRQTVEPTMNVTMDQALAIVAAAEREFKEETRDWRRMRDRMMHAANGRQATST